MHSKESDTALKLEDWEVLAKFGPLRSAVQSAYYYYHDKGSCGRLLGRDGYELQIYNTKMVRKTKGREPHTRTGSGRALEESNMIATLMIVTEDTGIINTVAYHVDVGGAAETKEFLRRAG